MADYGTIKAALADALEASTAVEIAFENPPDVAITPCAIIVPGGVAVEYGDAMQRGLIKMFFTVTFMVQRFDFDNNIARLDPLIYGTDSVDQLIATDRTLGGTVSYANVVSCTNIGNIGYGDEIYLGAEFEIEVMVEP
jgi:hypothetical protein